MLTKIVNGIEVVMGAEEEKAIRAEWAANEAADKLKIEQTPSEKIRTFLENNPDVMSEVTKTK